MAGQYVGLLYTYHISSLTGEVIKEGVSMFKNTVFAGITEQVCHIRVIAPCEDSSVVDILWEQVARPADIAFGPGLDSRSTQAMDENEIDTAIPFLTRVAEKK